MPLQLFHNELSAQSEDDSLDVAIDRLINLVRMLRAARAHFEFVLNLDVPVADLTLTPTVSLAAIRNHGRCVEEGLYLKRIRDRSPLRQAAIELDVASPDGYEYFLASGSPLGRRRSSALGLAHRHDGVAISLPSHAFWQSERIDLEMVVLDADAKLVTSLVQARNACSVEAIEACCVDVRASLRSAAEDGAALWASRSDLFPNLRFAPRVQAEIEGLPRGDPRLEPVVKTLSGIDWAVERWRRRGEGHPSYPFHVTGESPKRKLKVLFDDGTGVSRCFEDHARFTPGAGRVHFILETDPHRHALIGYVGRKIA